MCTIKSSVKKELSKYELSSEDKILIAVSGGSDSTALFLVLKDLSEEVGFKIHVATVDHCLRNGSAEDTLWVHRLCTNHNILCSVLFGDAQLEKGSSSLEYKARQLRYRLLLQEAKEVNANYLAIAHNSNDLVETMVWRLFKGAPLTQLCGIPKSREVNNVKIIRPLIYVSRDVIDEYIIDHNIDTRFDESNNSMDYLRNQIRHKVLPEVRKVIPEVDKSLIELSKRNEEILEALSWTGKNILLESQVSENTHLLRVLKSVPDAILRLIIRRILIDRGVEPVKERSIEEVISLIKSPTHKHKTFVVKLPKKTVAFVKDNLLCFE